MRKKIIVANWKSNKNPNQAVAWLDELNLKTKNLKLNNDNFEVVICPPYLDLPSLKDKLSVLSFPFSVNLGTQDISPFPDGSYTGAVSANQIKDYAKYCLVGHSERRKFFNETTDLVGQKIDLLITLNIVPIICARDENDIPVNIKNYNTESVVLMFEPASAISKNGVYAAEDPMVVKKTLDAWRQKYGDYQILYGGSVNGDNAKSLIGAGSEGFVSGRASLETDTFIAVLQNV